MLHQKLQFDQGARLAILTEIQYVSIRVTVCVVGLSASRGYVRMDDVRQLAEREREREREFVLKNMARFYVPTLIQHLVAWGTTKP